MKGYCKNCGHWLVSSLYDPRPYPHLKRTCYKCGSVWVEGAKELLRTMQILPAQGLETRPSLGV